MGVHNLWKLFDEISFKLDGDEQLRDIAQEVVRIIIKAHRLMHVHLSLNTFLRTTKS
jgi:hypothetical protein